MTPAKRRRYRRVGYGIGIAIGLVVLTIAAMRAKGNDWGPQ